MTSTGELWISLQSNKNSFRNPFDIEQSKIAVKHFWMEWKEVDLTLEGYMESRNDSQAIRDLSLGGNSH